MVINKETWKQFLKFTCFSLGAGIIQIVSFTLLNELARLPYWFSYLISLVLSVLYNFTINRRFTFKSANNVAKAMLLVLGYYVVFTPISCLWTMALTDGKLWEMQIMTGCGVNEYLILIPTMIVNMLTEFLFCKFVVYRNQSSDIEKAANPTEAEHLDK